MPSPNSLIPARSRIVAGIMRHLKRSNNQTSRAIAKAIGAKVNTVEAYMSQLVKRTDEFAVHVSSMVRVPHPKSGTVLASAYSLGVCDGLMNDPRILGEDPATTRTIPLDPLLAAIGGFR